MKLTKPEYLVFPYYSPVNGVSDVFYDGKLIGRVIESEVREYGEHCTLETNPFYI